MRVEVALRMLILLFLLGFVGGGDFLVYSSINSFTQNKVCVCTMFSGLTPQDKTADQRRDISHPFFLMVLALPGVQPDEIRIKKKPLSLEVTWCSNSQVTSHRKVCAGKPASLAAVPRHWVEW